MSADSAKIAFCLIGDSDIRPFNLSPRERLRRSFARAGIATEIAYTETETWDGAVIVVRADYVMDDGLVAAMANAVGIALRADNGDVVAVHAGHTHARAGVEVISGQRNAEEADFAFQSASELASTYSKALRKRARPILVHAGAGQAAIEKLLFGGSYKGVTDLVTKYVWPLPALLVTRLCARHGITPNMVTWVSLGCVILATALFWHGWFVWGLVAAWGMCFLDTVDGKLARCTLTSTKLGDVFDHGIDLLHPPFWYYAWFAGLGAVIAAPLSWALWVVILGYVAGRLQEGLFIWRFGIEIHTWRPVDSWFRLITARRNPNLLILTVAALLKAPDTGLELIAWWTIVSFIFHCVRIAQAFYARMAGRPPRSWLQAPLDPRTAEAKAA
ncbi:MAG TPA: CDP-alcohol phosphatidyltransferase family protein [Dongiaceae bacterium]|nr:CDP-alcohol phosphatidyltransferase family protein [Dongiaceae bacterium]